MKTSFFGWAMGIVAVSALVACGDDTTAGTGGGGGEDGQGGATTATTTTTTGNTTSTTTGNTTSTTTGGEGGSGGEGGGTGGSEPQCTEITIADLAGNGNILRGTVDPALGGADDDFGQVEFWDSDVEGNPLDGFEPGTYDLSEETSYATCARCVVVFEDVGEEAVGRSYFQSGGTLVLAEEGAAINQGFGTVSLSDVTLVEVEIDPETLETTVVPGGACLHIESLEYDNPVVPEAGALCEDLTDNDLDGAFDCDDDTNCGDEAACTPGATAVGEACDANSDCAAANGAPICLTEEFFGFQDGACGEWCDLANDDCPAGNTCADFGLEGRGICMPSCTTDDDCRADARCAVDDGICIPDPAVCGDQEVLLTTDDGDTTNGGIYPNASCTGGGLSVAYSFTTVLAGEYTFTLASATDQGIAIFADCADASSEVECLDAQLGGTDEVLTIALDAATNYTVIVAAYGAGEEGPYTVTVDGP